MSEMVEFQKIVNERMRITQTLLTVKGVEYARNGNPFHNFDRAARIEETIAPKTLHGFMLKHWVSYLDMLDDIQSGKQVSEKLVDEKLGDLITYLTLQEGLIKLRYVKKI